VTDLAVSPDAIRWLRDIAILRFELGQRVYVELVSDNERTMAFLFRGWEI